jgi:hypothetical protein
MKESLPAKCARLDILMMKSIGRSDVAPTQQIGGMKV